MGRRPEDLCPDKQHRQDPAHRSDRPLRGAESALWGHQGCSAWQNTGVPVLNHTTWPHHPRIEEETKVQRGPRMNPGAQGPEEADLASPMSGSSFTRFP